MPFINTVAPHQQAARKFLEAQGAAQAKREFWFKIKFSACLLAGVAGGTFLFAVIFF